VLYTSKKRKRRERKKKRERGPLSPSPAEMYAEKKGGLDFLFPIPSSRTLVRKRPSFSSGRGGRKRENILYTPFSLSAKDRTGRHLFSLQRKKVEKEKKAALPKN